MLRVAGIYGPERGFLFQQFVKGEAVLSDGGNRWLNMVHRDDVISAILTAMELEPGIYNVADEELSFIRVAVADTDGAFTTVDEHDDLTGRRP